MNSNNRTLKKTTDIEGLVVTKNYIENDGANTNTTGWVTYADSSAVSPSDGIGGSPNVTLTRTTSSPISNDASFLLTKDNADRRGEGASYDFSVDLADRGRLLTIDFDYIAESPFTVSSGITESDIEVYLYDVTNAQLLSVSPKVLTKMGSSSKQFLGLFQTSTTSGSYRLILHVATTNASAWTFKFDNVKVSRANQQVLGAAITDSTAYTPTTTGWGTPTSVGVYYYRIGNMCRISGSLVLGTPTATDATVALPTGLAIDSSKISSNSVGTKVGTYTVSPRGGGSLSYLGNYSGITFYNGSDTSKIYFGKETGTTAISKLQGNDFSSGQTISFDIEVPIQGWSANAGSVINLQDQSEYWVQGGNGYGSTNNKIRKFSTVRKNTGSDFTVDNSSTLGLNVTINTSGTYSITYVDTFNTADGCGITLNSTQLTTAIYALSNPQEVISIGICPAANQFSSQDVVLSLTAGDIIRPHSGGYADGSASAYCSFRIVKIANQPALYGEPEAFITATGGTITTDGNYKVHTFNSSGTFTITDGAGLVDSLVVAGGGGSSSNGAGGGGAGGVLYTTSSYLSAAAYTVTVGAGGAGINDLAGAGTRGNAGSNSVFGSLTATGGGGGAYITTGGNGGSGGGGSSGSNAGGSGTVGQGNNGGAASGGVGGGGGGAGAAGSSGTGNGGNGISNSITGSAVTYGGGGGGSNGAGTNGTGGTGGGGAAAGTGNNGTANLGGGGGASNGDTNGGSGGSGVVIIRYQFQ